MKNPKENIIILTYGILIYQFISGESGSIFVYLFSVSIELFLVALLYVISNNNSSFYSFMKNFRVLSATVIFLLLNYALIFSASLKFDDLINLSGLYRPEVFTPFLVYKMQILLTILGISIAYFMEYRKNKKQKKAYLISESIVLYHGVKMWSLMGLTVLVLIIIPEKHYSIAIILLPVGRMLMEFFAEKKQPLNT